MALIFAGCALGFWYYSFRTAASPQTIRSGALLYTLIYPTADLGLMLVTGAAILKATHPTTRRALAWLFAARGAKVAATSVYSLLKFGGGHSSGQWTYAPGHWIDGLWFAAWVFAWIAARVPQYRLASGAVEPEREQRRSYRSGGLPVLSFLFAQGLLLWLLREELNAAAGIVAVATTLLTGLIALRQVAELKENKRLRSLERSQEARFRSLVQQGSDILLVVGGGGELLYRSPSAERLIPRAGKEQEPSSLGALFDDVDVAGLRALIARVEPGRDAGSVPARALRADGKVMHLEFLATDLRHDPAVGGVVLTGWDVTERHELESELRHTEKLRAVGQTAGGIAHDLNNMLFAVRANTSLLLEDLPPDSPARAEAVEIGRAADRAAAVTRKLLQFSRREIAQPVTLDLNVVVAELEPVLRQFISSGIDVRFDYAPAEAWVVIDRLQMEQVVLNLSMNARDAMHDGGILRLRIDQAAAGHQPAGPGPTSRGEVAIEIEDNGIGMDEATKSHIFEPFFTTKPQGQGTGLGLATVYGIVTSAAGRLQVESSRGKGTTFTVFLPRASAPAEASRPEP